MFQKIRSVAVAFVVVLLAAFAAQAGIRVERRISTAEFTERFVIGLAELKCPDLKDSSDSSVVAQVISLFTGQELNEEWANIWFASLAEGVTKHSQGSVQLRFHPFKGGVQIVAVKGDGKRVVYLSSGGGVRCELTPEEAEEKVRSFQAPVPPKSDPPLTPSINIK